MKFDTGVRMAILAVVLALGGCHSLSRFTGSCHDPKPYMTAKSIPPLQIPAGLDAADTSNSMKIPRLAEPAPPPRHGNDPCLDQPPPYATPKAATPQA
jgi:uncharacterized lipoprotein